MTIDIERCNQLLRFAMDQIVDDCGYIRDQRFIDLSAQEKTTVNAFLWREYSLGFSQAQLTLPDGKDWRKMVEIGLDEDMFVSTGETQGDDKYDDWTVVGAIPPYETDLSRPAKLLLRWQNCRVRRVDLGIINTNLRGTKDKPNERKLLVVARRLPDIQNEQTRRYSNCGDFVVFAAQTRSGIDKPWQVTLTKQTPVIGYFRPNPAIEYDWVFVPRTCSRVIIQGVQQGAHATFAPLDHNNLFGQEHVYGVDGTYVPVFSGDILSIDDLFGNPEVTIKRRSNEKNLIWPDRPQTSW